MDKLTTADIAAKVGQSPSTIKHWQKKYGINREIKKGRALYTPDEIQIFEAVQELLAKGAGDTTIKKRIGSDNSQTMTSQQPDNDCVVQPLPEQGPSQSRDNLGIDATQIRVILRDELVQQNDLAEKYARATYRIGELEAEARGKDAKIAEQAEKIKLLVDTSKIEQKQLSGFMRWLQKLFR